MKPMLACSTIPSLEDISYPVIASPKLDGIRCLIVNGKAVSRNLKPIPNKYVREKLESLNLDCLDGELILRNGADFNSVQSAFMSEQGEPDFVYIVFDSFRHPMQYYNDRSEDAMYGVFCKQVEKGISFVDGIRLTWVASSSELQKFYTDCLTAGFEGAIIRQPFGPYKYGRSTLKQGWMLKLKPSLDDEATIISVEELQHNTNEAEIGELGQTKRSKHQDNLVSGDTLGSLVVSWQGVEFKIGTGFNMAQRNQLWTMRKDIIGDLVKFKYQEVSKYGVPRFPVFLEIRSKADLS